MNPAIAGPLIDAYITVKVRIIFLAGLFSESFYDFGLKKGGPCLESRVGPLSESENTLADYVNGEIFATEKRWFVFRYGPLCEAVRYRVSTVIKYCLCRGDNVRQLRCWKGG